MKRCISLTIISIAMSSVHLTGAQNDKGSSPKSSAAVLARRVEGDELRHLTTSIAFVESLKATSTPGGIITILGCQREAITQRWRPSGYPLRDVLDWMVDTDTQYRWTSHDGVINLMPANGEPEILKTQIKSVEVKHFKSPGTAVRKILASPELLEALSRLGLHERLRAVVWPVDLDAKEKGHSLSFKNVSLREALNLIARTHGHAVWEYSEEHCNGRDEFLLDFLVQ